MKKLKRSRSSTTGCAILDIEELADHSCLHNFDERAKSRIRNNLLNWYDENYREMPWRKHPKVNCSTFDQKDQCQRAYEVWISEVMLQQTRYCLSNFCIHRDKFIGLIL